MSQQEFFPQSSSSYADELDALDKPEIQRPTSWSNTTRTGDMTKNEHPSAFEDAEIPAYSYPAQDRRASRNEEPSPAAQQKKTTRSQRDSQQGFQYSPDGDALEDGYRPYQVPSWARPQLPRNRSILGWFFLILAILALIKLIPILAALILALLGIGLFLILLPILIVLGFVLIFGGLVLFILAKMGFPVWHNLFGRQRWRRAWRR